MTDYLLFRLYGPLAAWGEPAVGEYRPSHTHPGKSAVVGLLAAALGIRRDEEARHTALAEGYGLAVVTRASGLLLRDYHTAQVPSQQRRVIHYTRRDELTWGQREDLNTILSGRDYRSDGLWEVALWQRPGAPHALVALQEALRRPRFTLYLGRKSCPPALPLDPQIVSANDIASAFGRVQFQPEEALRRVPREPARLFWDEDGDAGLVPQVSVTRRDLPASRARWQFTARTELAAPLAGEG